MSLVVDSSFGLGTICFLMMGECGLTSDDMDIAGTQTVGRYDWGGMVLGRNDR